MRFFATLRMTSIKGVLGEEEVVGDNAANHLLLKNTNVCHSE
jgi:hypothetical protein